MRNFLLKIEYDGSKFVGWQYQKNGVSVQGKIEQALKKIFKTHIRVNGAGRTDKGVHALGQYANFKINTDINDKKKFISSINYFLRNSLISIIKISSKNLSFNSRFSAKERTYEYKIINRESVLSLNKDKAWHIKKKLDLKLLKKGAKILEGTHDFSTFRASSCSAKSPIKKMNSIKIKKNGEMITITLKSKSFLQSQVRSIIGCFIHLSTKKWSLNHFNKVFREKKRSNFAPLAPAYGLYLKDIKY